MIRERTYGEVPPAERVNATIGTILGNTYRQLPQRRIWVNQGDFPITTALDVSQKSLHRPNVSLVTLRAFMGDPPEDLLRWHLDVGLPNVPVLLDATKEHIEALPQDLEEWGDIGKSEDDAAKIAQAAKLVFEHMRTPEDIRLLVKDMDNLDADRPHASRLLCITHAGQKALGIRIT